MRKIISFCCMPTLFLITAFSVFGQEQAEAPRYKEGDFWQFRVKEWDWITKRSTALGGDYEVLFKGGKFIVFELSQGPKTPVVDQSANALRRMLNIKSTLNYLEFPLFVGKKWTAEYKDTNVNTRQPMSRSADVQVTGVEKVSTLAGTFEVFRIDRSDTMQESSARYTLTSYYYSPEARAIVKFLYDSSAGGKVAGGKRELELITFGSAR